MWQDRESSKNCSGNFSVPEYFCNETLPKGKPEHLKQKSAQKCGKTENEVRSQKSEVIFVMRI
ncbi:MAG: hypothetical protein F6K18_14655 [Okeania sp. SIO2C2]|uniref:hypothetical protein n=1 Tax=Okeania sp. SIO2C2 TaxID=2607787 RepID=UPI0013B645B3|nr:hypothetical protein [Okeania sp. SIO2C2]NEP87959.1 hypothetical protein [Okeania sp. SIO2C2]